MPTNIDETELARLEDLAKEATSRPWRGDGHKECGYGWVKIPGFNTTGTERSAMLGQYLGADDDARYIAAACNAVPALVAEVRRLREKVEAWNWWAECRETFRSHFVRNNVRVCALEEMTQTLTAAREAVHVDRE